MNGMPHITRRLALFVIAALCAVTSPALAGTSAQPPVAAPPGPGGGSAVTVSVGFTVRPVIVLVVDGSGAPTQLWTNIPGTPTADRLDAVQARRDGPRGTPVAIDPELRAQLPAVLAAARWGSQGLVWQRG